MLLNLQVSLISSALLTDYRQACLSYKYTFEGELTRSVNFSTSDIKGHTAKQASLTALTVNWENRNLKHYNAVHETVLEYRHAHVHTVL